MWSPASCRTVSCPGRSKMPCRSCTGRPHTPCSIHVLCLVWGVLLALPAICVPVLGDVHHGPVMIQYSQSSRMRLVQKRSMDPLSHIGRAKQGSLSVYLLSVAVVKRDSFRLGNCFHLVLSNPLLGNTPHFPWAYLLLSSVLAAIFVLSCIHVPLDSIPGAFLRVRAKLEMLGALDGLHSLGLRCEQTQSATLEILRIFG